MNGSVPTADRSGGAPAPDPRGRRFVVVVLLGVVCGALLTLGWVWGRWSGDWGVAPEAAPQTVSVRIYPGMTMAATADTLVARGLLRERRLFLIGARLSGRDRALQTGLYELPVGVSPRRLLRELVDARPVPVRVTVPEGVEAELVAELVAQALGCTPAAFLAAADSVTEQTIRARGWLGPPQQADRYDALLADGAVPGGRPLHWSEGYLAPDTYHFAEGTAAREVARTMVSLQITRLDSLYLWPVRWLGELNLPPHAVLTLASIVEAEARRDDERARIAAVYLNRLRRGGRLEADPTVAYALDKRGQRLLYRDLRVASAYNTYLHAGLPPGPIGNPGRAALTAAVRPDTTCDAYYFVADGQGGHVFSRTSAEHRAAVARYRRQRSEQR